MTAYINKEWIFGDFMCHFENLLIFVRDSFIYIFEFIGLFLIIITYLKSSIQAYCLTLTAMTIDRYLAVIYPFKSIEYRTTKFALYTNIFIWIGKAYRYSFLAYTSR